MIFNVCNNEVGAKKLTWKLIRAVGIVTQIAWRVLNCESLNLFEKKKPEREEEGEGGIRERKKGKKRGLERREREACSLT